MKTLCAFANSRAQDSFIHPAMRAILLHFMLGYDHPFVDGNGRTARALFYWSMASQGYWLTEYVTISRILRNAPSQYARAYLYVTTDDNDTTYFIHFHLNVLLRGIRALYDYLARKVQEMRDTEILLNRSSALRHVLNHRQIALLNHALKHPGSRYEINGHQRSHNITYQTARTDLLKLAEVGLLAKRKISNKFFFDAPSDIHDRFDELSAK